MSAMTNILLKDDATTPVEVTLVPVTDNPIPYWRGNTSGVPLEGQIRLYESVEQVKSGAWKVTAKLEVPVMETLGASGSSAGYVAPPKVAYVNTGIVTMFVDKRSTEADRYNTLKMLAGVLAGASSSSGTGTLDNASAGDAWKGSTAPGPLFFGQLVVPN